MKRAKTVEDPQDPIQVNCAHLLQRRSTVLRAITAFIVTQGLRNSTTQISTRPNFVNLSCQTHECATTENIAASLTMSRRSRLIYSAGSSMTLTFITFTSRQFGVRLWTLHTPAKIVSTLIIGKILGANHNFMLIQHKFAERGILKNQSLSTKMRARMA